MGNNKTSLWYDNWSGLGCSTGFVRQHHRYRVVMRDLVKEEKWDLRSLYTSIPDEVEQKLLNLEPILNDNRDDMWVWGSSVEGCYSTREAYT